MYDAVQLSSSGAQVASSSLQPKNLTQSTDPRYVRGLLGCDVVINVRHTRAHTTVHTDRCHTILGHNWSLASVDWEEIPFLEFPGQATARRETFQVYEFLVEATTTSDLCYEACLPKGWYKAVNEGERKSETVMLVVDRALHVWFR